jgi:hypothetical protein
MLLKKQLLRYGTSRYDRKKPPLSEDLRVSRMVSKIPIGGEWPWEKKYEVVIQMKALANKTLVSQITGVSYETITRWQKLEWWKELEQEIKREQSLKLDSKLTQIIEKSLDIVADRLENGNVVLNNKTGELIRKPVELKDVSRTATDLISKQSLIRKQHEEAVENKATIKETLALLATEFAKWTSKEKKKGATDLPFVEKT